MNLSSQQAMMDTLYHQAPAAWLEYLRPFEAGAKNPGLSMDVIWHTIAPRAKDQTSLEWAEVAIRSAEVDAHNQSHREAALWRAMMLRAWFISQMGSRPHHHVLSKNLIVDWVLDGLEISVASAKEKSGSLVQNLGRVLKSPNPENAQPMIRDLKILRRIKRRLEVVQMLSDCGELPADSVLNEWLKIRELLP